VALCSGLAALADNRFDRCTLFRCGVIFYAINAPALISIRRITAEVGLSSAFHAQWLRFVGKPYKSKNPRSASEKGRELWIYSQGLTETET
jgi:hypothetical protein